MPWHGALPSLRSIVSSCRFGFQALMLHACFSQTHWRLQLRQMWRCAAFPCHLQEVCVC